MVFYFLKQLDFKYNESYHVYTKYKGDTIMENNKTNNSLTGYKGLTYTQEAKGADAKTKEGQVHNLVVKFLKVYAGVYGEPTAENIADTAWYLTEEEISCERNRAFIGVQDAKKYGPESVLKAWQSELKAAEKKIKIVENIAKTMDAIGKGK